MKRIALIIFCIAFAVGAAEEKWWELYNRGVNAVNAGNYAAGSDALTRAIGAMPAETTTARTPSQVMVYVPHFWLGIAKFNLGDVDAALREWKVSEEQGAVQNTRYYSQLRDWQSRALQQKQRNSEDAAREAKNAADAAVRAAVLAQGEALTAGADRSEMYRTANAALLQAIEQLKHAGSDQRAIRRAEQLAGQSREMFAGAAEEAKRLKAQRAQAKPQPQPAQPAPQPISVVVPFTPPPSPAPQPQPVAPQPVVPTQVESEALVGARIAVQNYKRRLLESGTASPALLNDVKRFEKDLAAKADTPTIVRINAEVAQREKELSERLAAIKGAPAATGVTKASAATLTVTMPPIARDDARAQLESAFRAYASGDLTGSEQLLTMLINNRPLGEAYLLRGCARYTEAMLSRKPDALLAGATDDFKNALRINRSYHLDSTTFSPKLVQYFERVKKQD